MKKKIHCFLRCSLESIFSQTIMPSEVVLCEDGKLTSELEKIICEYENKYSDKVKVLKFSKNRGLGLTLRDGIYECSNEIIFRMDADDVSMRDRFEKQLKIINRTDVDVVGSNVVEYDKDMKNVFGFRNVPETNVEIKTFAKRRNPVNHMTVCFKKSKVLRAGNYVDMPSFEDYYLWVRMIHDGCTFYNIQEPLVMVRGGNDMIRRRGGKEYMKSTLRFERELLKTNFITKKEFLENIGMRSLSVASPNFIRKKVYQVKLRGKR